MSDTGNSFRNEAKRRREKQPTKPASKGKFSFKLPEIDWENHRGLKIFGLFILLLSFFLFLSMVSYLFTWKQDQSFVYNSSVFWQYFFKGGEKLPSEIAAVLAEEGGIRNWAGKLGAFVSHQLILRSFGLASFALIGFLFVWGYRMLMGVRLFSLRKAAVYALLVILIVPVIIAFANSFISKSLHYPEGVYGYQTNIWLNMVIGKAGTAILLLFMVLAMIVMVFNPDFSFLKFNKKRKPDSNDEDSDFTVFQRNVLLEQEKVSTPIDLDPERFNNPAGKTVNEIYNERLKKQQETAASELTSAESEKSPTENTPEEKGPSFSIEQTEEEKTAENLVQEFGAFDPTLELANYQFPPLDLLEEHGSSRPSVSTEELEANKDKIVGTLGNYGIEIDKIKATIGPTVTLYEIVPSPGVRISKIRNLEDDIALSLAALGIRIIAPIPGRGTIGIEVPNLHPEIVSMRSVLATEKYQSTTMELPIALGKNISNEVYITDLAKMPHLLMAGATGQGKSVGINALLCSLLYKKHPSQIKFVLVDPKKVELTIYRQIERHFLAKLPGDSDAIITDTKQVIHTLNSLCIEMDDRYELLKNAGVRNIKEYNKKFISRRLNPNEKHRFLPYIVLVVDEFADLMMTAGREIETPIARLAQLARAIGIHLVIATQRPSVNIITGTIKANFPARIAFRVTSKIDSRTILDTGGADQLIGRGDMLLSTGSDVMRLQCAFVDTPEVEKVTEFIGSQRAYPNAYELPEYVDENGEGGLKDIDLADRDAMFEDAARVVVMHQQGSTSLIQRKLKLGYNRAGRIIDQLEAAGIVGSFEGSKAREVLVQDEYALEQLLNEIK